MENQDGFRWDIFVNVVCGGLSLSSSMNKTGMLHGWLFSLMGLKKGNATKEEISHEFGVDDIEKHLEYLVQKKLVVRNGDGSYSLNLIL